MTAPDVRTPGGNLASADQKTDAAIVVDAACLDKPDSTLVALAAIAGFQLRKLADGRWRVERWNLSRELNDTGAVRAFLAGAGVRVSTP